MLQPDPKPSEPVSEATESTDNPSTRQPDNPNTRTPDNSNTRTPDNPTTRIPDRKITLNPDVLDRVELRPATDLKIDPNIISKSMLLQPFMSEGKQVPMALAFYYNKKSPTEYNEAMSLKMGGYVRSILQREISLDVLTKAFHQSSVRERVVLRGTADADKRLKASRTPYLLLLDVRSEVRNKGTMRICLFDVARQKGYTKGRSVTVRDGSGNIIYGEMAGFVKEYIMELRERGLLK